MKYLMFAGFLLSQFSIAVYGLGFDDPKAYISSFHRDILVKQIESAKLLSYAGLSSPEVFDPIEKNLRKYVHIAEDRDVDVQYVAWLTRALGYSGNEKYIPTIEYVQQHARRKSLKKHAVVALAELPEYAQANKLIVPISWPENPYPTRDERLFAMIKSDLPRLQLGAARYIYDSQSPHPTVLSALQSTIESNYLKSLNGDQIDAVAWMCKALANSGNPEYQSLITTVANSAKEKKLRKYASDYNKTYYKKG